MDNDADQDLYIINDYGDQVVPNLLLENTGPDAGWAVRHVDDQRGLDVQMDGMGLGIGDINGDLLPDFLISDWGRVRLLESDAGFGWYDTAASRGLTLNKKVDRWVGWGAELADIDNDGDLDALIGFGPVRQKNPDQYNPEIQPDGLWLQDEEGQFLQSAEQWDLAQNGNTRGFAVTDLSGDGWLDVVKGDYGGQATYHQSRCGAESWLIVILQGPPPNRQAIPPPNRQTIPPPNRQTIGARVVVEANGVLQTRWITTGSVLASSGPAEAHFGLGDVEEIDFITVFWPDGEVSTADGPTPRQRVSIRRKDADQRTESPGHR